MMRQPVWGGGSLHLVYTDPGSTKEAQASVLVAQGSNIILNPFVTSLWPQDPTNMTSSPHITVPTTVKGASWRRMQLTSPPIVQADLHLWITKGGKGSQLLPSTGKAPAGTGVTLGDLADLLADQPKKGVTLHWMEVQSHAWWVLSADAVVVPPEGDVGNNDARPGVYVNPSNGVAFPGAF